MARKSKMIRMNPESLPSAKAALYIRVSTDRQAEEGYSIDVQKERLQAYATSMFGSSQDAAFYIDDGFSGGSLDRPQMQKLICDIEKHFVSHVIVYKLDRLSRSQKDTLHLIEDIFLPNQVSFISVQESFNTATPFGRAVIGILSVFAQFERENIFERTRSGMQKRVEAGYWMGGGRVPFGYDYDSQRGILVPNGDAEKVKKLYDLYIQGWSLQKIADVLNLKYEKLALQILQRKSNAGYIIYNGKEYQGLHKAIIPLQTYEEAMKIFRSREKNQLRPTATHLLTGLVYCGCCGAKMRYIRWGKKGYKLMCYSQQKTKRYLIHDPDCQNPRPWADDIEDHVLTDIFQATKNFEPSAAHRNTHSLEMLEQKLSISTKKLRKLYGLYADAEDDILLDTIHELKKQIQSIEKQIETENTRNQSFKQLQASHEELCKLSSIWNMLENTQKIAALRSIVDRIIITNDCIDIVYKV